MTRLNKWAAMATIIGTIIAVVAFISSLYKFLFEDTACQINASDLSVAKKSVNINESIKVSIRADNPKGQTMTFNWQAVHGEMDPSLRSPSASSTYTAPSIEVDDTISVEVTMADCEPITRSVQVSVVNLATPTQTITPTELTETSVPPSDTPIPATHTSIPPSETSIPATHTSIPEIYTPIPVNTPIPASETPTPASDTPTIQTENIPDDIPGYPLKLGDRKTSKIDKETKPRDVYQVKLRAGEVLQVKLESKGHVDAHIFSSNASSINSNEKRLLCSGTCLATFNAATEGNYYVSVSTNEFAVEYIISVDSKGVIPLPRTVDIIPSDIDLGATAVTSVIDVNTKLRDVYRVKLKAGEVLRVWVEVEGNQGTHAQIFTPNAISINSKSYKHLCEGTCQATFNAAIEGYYYISIFAQKMGIKYTINAKVINVIQLPETVSTIPSDFYLSLDAIPVTSIIDQSTKQRDVYIFKLKKGDVLQVSIEVEGNRHTYAQIFTPDAKSISSNSNKHLCERTCQNTFSAETEGDYHITVSTNELSVKYTISARLE